MPGIFRSKPDPFSINPAAVDTFEPDHPVQALYDRAIRISQDGLGDNGNKRARYFARQQLVAAALARWPSLDIAECGCWRGHSTIMTAEAAKKLSFSGRFSVFDSFAGLSDFTGPDLTNPRTAEQQQRTKLHFAAPEQHLRDLTHGYGFVDIYPGWIPHEFHHVADRTFSFVHIDVDLHDPTRDALEFFYQRLTPGGSIFIDDYGYKSFPGARVAVDAFLRTTEHAMFLVSPVGGAAIIK
jgi:O-methyltransferase